MVCQNFFETATWKFFMKGKLYTKNGPITVLALLWALKRVMPLFQGLKQRVSNTEETSLWEVFVLVFIFVNLEKQIEQHITDVRYTEN